MVDIDLKSSYNTYMHEEKIKHPKKSFFQEFMNPTPPIKEFYAQDEIINKAVADDDIAIIAIGRNAGEGRDRKPGNDFNLSDTERTMIKNITDGFHAKNKKAIVVLNIGGVIEMASWNNIPDAILLAWQPGLEGGNAIADLLSGKVNPSGKLAVTFPVTYEDEPSAKSFPGKEFPDQATTGNFGMKSIPAEVTYDEGIYVGYRYYNTYHIKPSYEFGYGLSYTKFTYSNLKLSSQNFAGKITASVEIRNAGNVAGKEVVQLYVSAPDGNLNKPSEELKGFAKTSLLQPGKSQTITFTLNAADLASFNTKSTSWIADAGKYEVKVGASSTNFKQTANFTLGKSIVVEKDHKVLAPQVEINEFTGK